MRLSLLLWSALLLLAGCAPSGNGASGDDDDDATEPCAYPEGSTEPMEVGEVLTPYRWETGIHGDGREATVDLETMPCASDDVIDWSPFDVLLFVSIPAW